MHRVTGRTPAELHPRQMWPVLAKTPGFYDTLEWLDDGRRLWAAVKNLNPVILTGIPLGKWAEPQKRSWCRRELGDDVPVVIGLSRRKADLAHEWMVEMDMDRKTPVLVDDRLKMQESWEAAGGRFILHLNFESSIQSLKNMGIPVTI